MADKRKLQGEIDRCLKKVQEGIDTFEDIWQKVHSSANANQKEKYEADLKKEIKKLQRQRDHIKTWLASSDIKDKRALVENRKLIETQMERFKVVERETKTKAYSKEGLGAASKLDPAAKEKQEVTNWISQMIDNLNIQYDQFDSEVEQLTSGNKKKKLDKDYMFQKNERFEQLKANQERHTYHIKKLETIMRMVDNETLPLEQIKTIREDIEYYVDSNQDPDFEENELIYDELELDELEAGLLPPSPTHDEDHLSDKLSTTPTSTNSSSPSPSPGIGVNHSKDEDRKKYKATEEMKNKVNASSSSSVSSLSSNSSLGKVPITPTKLSSQSSVNLIDNSINHLPSAGAPPNPGCPDGQNSHSGSPVSSRLQNNLPVSVWQRNPSSALAMRHLNFTDSSSSSSETTKIPSTLYNNHVSVLSSNMSSSVLVNNSLNTLVNSVSSNSIVGNPSIPPSPHSAPLLSNGHDQEHSTLSSLTSVYSAPSIINGNNNSVNTSLSSSQSSSVLPASQSNNAIIAMNTLNSLSNLNASKAEILPVVKNGPINAGGILHKDVLSESLSSLKTIAQQAVMKTTSPDNQITSTSSESTPTFTKMSSYTALSQPSPHQQQQSPVSQDNCLTAPELSATTTIHLNRLLGVAPLGPVPLVKEHLYQLAMGEAAFYHLPHPSDSERLRLYLPRNPCPTPPYYPQLPPLHQDSVEFFQRLSTETLFFIFYYMEGTKAQYLAAKALKKQSWRFHTKYMMWFQRHEEPKIINEDYEQGTYIYFDYEKWGQRKKEGFTFEYRYLEDQDLN